MKPYNIFENIKTNLQKKENLPRLSTDKLDTHSPSSSMCDSAIDSKPIGSCIRSNYLKRMKAPESNPTDIYVTMACEAGNLWENWIIDQYKDLGIYIDHSVRVTSFEYNISGEIDILHLNPNTNELEISEIKQYNGSNYYAAAELKGSSKIKPKPKDQNLLQVFDYLLTVKDSIKYINLVYVDRSCGSYYNNIQFIIRLADRDGIYYPLITYFKSDGTTDDYIDPRINSEVTQKKKKELENYIRLEEIPPKDYQIKYDSKTIEMKYSLGEISKTKYTKWRETNESFGDWNCSYCRFGPGKDGFSVCESLDED